MTHSKKEQKTLRIRHYYAGEFAPPYRLMVPEGLVVEEEPEEAPPEEPDSEGAGGVVLEREPSLLPDVPIPEEPGAVLLAPPVPAGPELVPP